MKWTKPFIVSSTLCMLMAGCATLQIRVDQYMGDQNLGGDAQLAEALDEAVYVRQAAKEFCGRLRSENRIRDGYSKEWKQVADTVQTVVDNYHSENIDGLKQTLDKTAVFGKQGKRNTAYVLAERQLALALVRYGQLCVSTGQRIGIPALYNPFWKFYSAGREPVIAGVALESSGSKMRLLAANVLDYQQYSGVASMLQSINRGVVTASLLSAAGDQARALESNDWKYINTVGAGGIGKTNYVFVKDDVGNWGIKTVSNDPSEVIDAAFDGATAMVSVLAAAYGIPIPNASGGAASPNSTAAATDAMSNTAQQATARQDAAKIRRWQLSLKYNLKQAMTTPAATQSQTIVALVKQYEAQLKSLHSYAPPASTSAAAD